MIYCGRLDNGGHGISYKCGRVEYGDKPYQCGCCARKTNEALVDLLVEYIKTIEQSEGTTFISDDIKKCIDEYGDFGAVLFMANKQAQKEIRESYEKI